MQNFLAWVIKVINNIERVDILFKWCESEVYIQSSSQLESDKLEVERDDFICGGKPHIYTLFYRKKGNAKD